MRYSDESDETYIEVDNTPTAPQEIHSSMRRLVEIVSQSFVSLNKKVDRLEIEKLCSVIHQVMSAKYRQYHNLSHIFQMVEEHKSPIARIAIVFHDLVYLNVDRRIHPLIQSFLNDGVLSETYEYTLPKFEDDPLLALVGKVFNTKSGAHLTSKTAVNEFLSALVAVRMLPKSFSNWELIQISACIEATIPFRSKDNQGRPPPERLAQRLQDICNEYSFKVKESEINECIQMSIQVAQSDLKSFSGKDLGQFLSDTWSLILEGNPAFRNPLYTVRQYRMALQKVEGFYSSLNAELVVPELFNASKTDVKERERRVQLAKTHLQNGCTYLRAKILSTAVLEALAEVSGGDAPISLMIGESPKGNDSPKAPLEYYLDYSLRIDHSAITLAVYNVLKFGRETPSGFDFKHSPLSIFLYERINREEFSSIYEASIKMFEGKTTALSVLKTIPKALLDTIIDAVSIISWTRAERLKDIKKQLRTSSNSSLKVA